MSNFISMANGYIMFNIIDNKLVVLDRYRRLIFGDEKLYSHTTEFHVFSSSVVTELLRSGNASTVTVELRRDVLSVTNGDYTMEYSLLCPPVCPNKTLE